MQGPFIVDGGFSLPCFADRRQDFTVEYCQGQFQLGPYRGELLTDTSEKRSEEDAPSSPLISSVQMESQSESSSLLQAGQMRGPHTKVLSLQQQLSNLKAKYAEPGVFEHPLLPPYSLQQVEAIEAERSFRFTPLLRLYLLHISRQQAISYHRYTGQDTSFPVTA